MSRNAHQRLKSIGLKVSEEAFERLRALAERSRKPLAEWCRERVLETLRGVSPTPAQHAVLAEILALQDTIVGLLGAMGRDGRLTSQKTKEIVDAAHERKYRDVAALFRDAEAEFRRSTR